MRKIKEFREDYVIGQLDQAIRMIESAKRAIHEFGIDRAVILKSLRWDLLCKMDYLLQEEPISHFIESSSIEQTSSKEEKPTVLDQMKAANEVITTTRETLENSYDLYQSFTKIMNAYRSLG